jgi:large repetitive protein
VTRHSKSLSAFLPLRRAAGLVAAAAVVLVAAGPAGAAGGPVSKSRPAITGIATAGSRLVAWPGSWSATGKPKYSYQWYRCDTMGRHCRHIPGARERIHRPNGNDVGHTLSVAVRATDGKGTTVAFTSLIGPIAGARPRLDSLAQPVIAGAAVQGKTVRVDAGRWRPKPSGFVYQWARCNLEVRSCEAILGETHHTHAIGAADLGHVLVAIVQARAGRTSRAVFSQATEVAGKRAAKPAHHVVPKVAVAPKPVAVPKGGKGPSMSSAPIIAEVLQEGNPLTGSLGTWSGSGAIVYTYSWYRCDATGAHCKTIHGATKATYLQRTRDVSHTLGFAVHATDSTGRNTAYAPLLGPVAAATATLVSIGAPTVSGAAAPGQTLQVSSGSWNQAPGAFAYQWQRCNPNGRLCTPIGGATAPTYVPTADDSGHKLLAVVHATAGAAAQDALSTTTPVVAPPPSAGPSNTAAPTVAGTAGQGSQLTGAAGTWTSAATINYSFNWFRCDAAGAHCLSVHGATKPTYTQGAKDVGHTLGFAVHATDSAGTTTAYASLVGPIAAVNAPLSSTGQPTISGTPAVGQTLEVSGGSWNQPPTALTYQWQRCNANGRLCTPITGATATTYAATAADSTHTLLVSVTATLNGAQQVALSAHTGVVP